MSCRGQCSSWQLASAIRLRSAPLGTAEAWPPVMQAHVWVPTPKVWQRVAVLQAGCVCIQLLHGRRRAYETSRRHKCRGAKSWHGSHSVARGWLIHHQVHAVRPTTQVGIQQSAIVVAGGCVSPASAFTTCVGKTLSNMCYARCSTHCYMGRRLGRHKIESPPAQRCALHRAQPHRAGRQRQT